MTAAEIVTSAVHITDTVPSTLQPAYCYMVIPVEGGYKVAKVTVTTVTTEAQTLEDAVKNANRHYSNDIVLNFG